MSRDLIEWWYEIQRLLEMFQVIAIAVVVRDVICERNEYHSGSTVFEIEPSDQIHKSYKTHHENLMPSSQPHRHNDGSGNKPSVIQNKGTQAPTQAQAQAAKPNGSALLARSPLRANQSNIKEMACLSLRISDCAEGEKPTCKLSAVGEGDEDEWSI